MRAFLNTWITKSYYVFTWGKYLDFKIHEPVSYPDNFKTVYKTCIILCNFWLYTYSIYYLSCSIDIFDISYTICLLIKDNWLTNITDPYFKTKILQIKSMTVIMYEIWKSNNKLVIFLPYLVWIIIVSSNWQIMISFTIRYQNKDCYHQAQSLSYMNNNVLTNIFFNYKDLKISHSFSIDKRLSINKKHGFLLKVERGAWIFVWRK